MNNKYVIMMIGKTHSGKTTLGYELEKNIPKGIVIQTDPISIFLKQSLSLNLDIDKEHDGSFKNPSLKIKLFNTIVEHAMDYGYIPILSNSNMHQKLRDTVINQIHQKGFKVIGIYLNFSEDFLEQRIKNAQRDKGALNTATSFEEVLIKQRDWFVPPQGKEFDYFFEIQTEDEILDVKNKIYNLVV